jgi:hypothetical protein
MSNDHVPEPFRSLLNDLTRSHRAAHEELREGMAALARAAALPSQSRYRRPPGECSFCDKYRDDPMMPPHTASDRCESGKHSHCTCDTCF